jgi:hypothetical protein
MKIKANINRAKIIERKKFKDRADFSQIIYLKEDELERKLKIIGSQLNEAYDNQLNNISNESNPNDPFGGAYFRIIERSLKKYENEVQKILN